MTALTAEIDNAAAFAARAKNAITKGLERKVITQEESVALYAKERAVKIVREKFSGNWTSETSRKQLELRMAVGALSAALRDYPQLDFDFQAR